jgi:hypothetical protein
MVPCVNKATFHPTCDAMDFLDQTIEVWQPYSDRPLTREDAREIAHNVMGFVRVLREWAEEEQRSNTSAEIPSFPS